MGFGKAWKSVSRVASNVTGRGTSNSSGAAWGIAATALAFTPAGGAAMLAGAAVNDFKRNRRDARAEARRTLNDVKKIQEEAYETNQRTIAGHGQRVDDFEAQARRDHDPFYQTGVNAVRDIDRLRENPDRLSEMADFQFDLQQGVKANDMSAARRGTLLSSGAAKKNIRFGQDYARSRYDTYVNRLTGIAQIGQNAANSMQNAGVTALEGRRGVANWNLTNDQGHNDRLSSIRQAHGVIDTGKFHSRNEDLIDWTKFAVGTGVDIAGVATGGK